MGVLLGLFVGFGLVLVRHQLDSTFSDVDDLRRFSNLSTLASIPDIRGGWFDRGRTAQLPTMTDGVSVASEQYRILTLRIRIMIDRECAQILLFTSSAGAEGKTTTAVNTAFALSQIQQDKVLLIDADLRKPGVRGCLTQVANGRLGPPEGLLGLVNSPGGLAPECFGRIGKLYILASADGSADSLRDVSSESLRKTLAKLRKQFKYIFIDSPPLLPMVDAHLLADLADRVVLVVRANRTRRETLARALQSFDMSKVLGFVLNGVDYSRARYGPVYDNYVKAYTTSTKPKRGAKFQIR